MLQTRFIKMKNHIIKLLNNPKINIDDGLANTFGDSTGNELFEVSYAVISINMIFFKPLKIVEKFAGETLPSLRPISSKSELQYKFDKYTPILINL